MDESGRTELSGSGGSSRAVLSVRAEKTSGLSLSEKMMEKVNSSLLNTNILTYLHSQ